MSIAVAALADLTLADQPRGPNATAGSTPPPRRLIAKPDAQHTAQRG